MLPGINRNQKHGGTGVWHIPKHGTEASQKEALWLQCASLWACSHLAQGLGGFFFSFWLEAFPHKERSPSNGEQKPN